MDRFTDLSGLLNNYTIAMVQERGKTSEEPKRGKRGRQCLSRLRIRKKLQTITDPFVVHNNTSLAPNGVCHYDFLSTPVGTTLTLAVLSISRTAGFSTQCVARPPPNTI